MQTGTSYTKNDGERVLWEAGKIKDSFHWLCYRPNKTGNANRKDVNCENLTYDGNAN